MKLVSKDHLFQIDTEASSIHKLVIENKNYYRNFIYNLYNKSKTDDSIFYLFDNLEELNFYKNFHTILQPTFVEINDRKNKNKIATQLIDTIPTLSNNDNLSKLLLDLHKLAESLISTSDFRLNYKHNLDIKDIINLFDFNLDSSSGSFVENLLEYILAIRTLDGINHFIIINLEDYINEDELIKFYENIVQENISIIDIECRFNKKFDYERILIIDKDLCLIEI